MLDAMILIGAPGSGKGTTADDLSKHVDFIHVSTGDMLREAIANGLPNGIKAKEYMTRGDLVPDQLIIDIVRERLLAGESDACYVFDGFPRTETQAEQLDAILDESARGRVSHVFLLEVARDVLVSRIAGRRICRDCGAVFHQTNIKPKVDGVCDHCGGALYQRADDTEETVLNRLEVFHQQTESLIGYYEQKGVLRRIDALHREPTIDQILECLNSSAS